MEFPQVDLKVMRTLKDYKIKGFIYIEGDEE